MVILILSISSAYACENISDIQYCADESVEMKCIQQDLVLRDDANGGYVPNESVELNSSGEVDEHEGNDIAENYSVDADDFTWYWDANPVYKFKITDSNGSSAVNKTAEVKLNNISYALVSDEKGTVSLPLTNLTAGNYTVSITCANKTYSRQIDLFESRVISNDITSLW